MKSMSNYSDLADGNLGNITTYQAGVMLAAANRTIQRKCDEILKSYDISKMHWLIIGTINDAGSRGMRITELSPILGTNLSYLTNTINLLESKKILERIAHPEDSRSKYVCISAQFRKRFDEIEAHLRNELRKSVYRDISPHDFRIYMKVLYQLTDI